MGLPLQRWSDTALLRRVETGKTKITCKGRSSFSYQPKASPAPVPAAAKGRMKLHPVWGLLHVTVPRDPWDSSGFRSRQRILLGLSCRCQGSGTSCSQAHAVPHSAGSPDRAASIAHQRALQGTGTSPVAQTARSRMEKLDPWDGLGPCSNCTSPQGSLSSHPCTRSASLGSALPGLLGPHREWEGAGGSEKPLFGLF